MGKNDECICSIDFFLPLMNTAGVLFMSATFYEYRAIYESMLCIGVYIFPQLWMNEPI